MNKISTAEQAAKECLELWTEIEKGVSSGKFEMLLYECGLYNMIVIKHGLIGNKNYLFNCPLCEYYKGNSNECPLSAGRCDCEYGCFECGYEETMTSEDIRKFLGALKDKLEMNK